MSKGLSFSAVLKLNKAQFDAGVREVKRSLNDLKSTFTQIAGALGAGLGLASFIGNMKETAVQLSVVKATLENVSKSTEEYGESLEFLRRIAKEYGQDQNALTMSFAKFAAAATGAGVSLEQVKSIFESLTRAAGAYHLSAESTASVMLAVEQMFSKGKVSAEELRRQLGNSLPGAFNMMAKAAGEAGITLNGTAAELDKAMKAGQVMASEVMPYFARELDKATQGANFDSLQSSLNRLSNSWYNFVEQTNMEGAFDSLVKAGSGALNLLTGGFKLFGLEIQHIAVAVAAGLGFKMLKKEGELALGTLNKSLPQVSEKLIAIGTELIQLERQFAQLKATDPFKQVSIDITQAQAKVAGLSDELLQQNAIYQNAEGTALTYFTTAGDAAKILDANIKVLNADFKAATAEATKMTTGIAKGSTSAGKAVLGLQKILKGLVGTLKAVVGMIALTFAIELIMKFIEKLKEAHDEAKRLRDLPENTLEEAKKMSSTTEEQVGHLKEQVEVL